MFLSLIDALAISIYVFPYIKIFVVFVSVYLIKLHRIPVISFNFIALRFSRFDFAFTAY